MAFFFVPQNFPRVFTRAVPRSAEPVRFPAWPLVPEVLFGGLRIPARRVRVHTAVSHGLSLFDASPLVLALPHVTQEDEACILEGLRAILSDPRISRKNTSDQPFKLMSEYAGYVALFL